MTVHWPVQVPILVRERDCGSQGELDEAALVVFFREARRAYLSVLNAGESPHWSRVVSLRMNVLRVATVDDDLAIRIRCDGVGHDEFLFRYLVRDRLTGETIAEASTLQRHDVFAEVGGHVVATFNARLMALEGRELPALLPSEVDHLGVVPSRSIG
jgi:acyl-CoA thioesterase FadM